MDDKQKYVENINEFDDLYNILNDTEQPTVNYWESVRARAAIVIMHAYLRSPAKPNEDVSLEKSVQNIVKIADALVEELKKKHDIWRR